jgi:hypothetical protein
VEGSVCGLFLIKILILEENKGRTLMIDSRRPQIVNRQVQNTRPQYYPLDRDSQIIHFHFKCNLTHFFVIKQTRCTNFTNLFCHETLHVRLSIIRSLFTAHSSMVYVIQVCRLFSSRTRMERKLYMFRTVRLSIIRSLFTVHSAMVYVIQVCRQSSSRIKMELRSILVLFESCLQNLCDIHHCWVYSE